MRRSIILLSCLVLLLASLVYANDKDTYAGKVHNKKMIGVERTIKGELVCLGCDLKESGARSDCVTNGHNMRFKSQNGLYLSLLTNKYSKNLLSDKNLLHKPLEITGYHFANAQTLDIISYTIGDNTTSWCTVCSKMDNCSSK